MASRTCEATGSPPGQTPLASGTGAAVGQGIRFITISRQAGSGGQSLATELANAINRLCPGDKPWCEWDHDLVEKVGAEHHIPNAFIEAMEDADHRWFNEFVASLSMSCDPEAFKVYRRVAMTIRALAGAGNAIIVGRGGVFITEGLACGLHLRLVAPVEFRVRQMADRLQMPLDEAAVRVHEIDRNRLTFYRQHWPRKSIGPESFAVTFNTAQVTEAQMVASLLPLIMGDQIAIERIER